MGAVWGVVKQGLALALALAEKGVFVLQGNGDPQQVRQPTTSAVRINPAATEMKRPHHACMHNKPQAARSNKFLWGNFAPVEGDLFAQSLPVTEGRISPELAGLFTRNGAKGNG